MSSRFEGLALESGRPRPHVSGDSPDTHARARSGHTSRTHVHRRVVGRRRPTTAGEDARSPMLRRCILLALMVCASAYAAPPALRVCSDPNNLPFSNRREEGFENRIAQLVARDLGLKVSYYWFAQRRGFVRNTLGAGRCDVIIGVPSSFELAMPTRPYYRSGYVFVTRRDRRLNVRSLDDPRLHKLKIGVQMIGDDYASSPPAHALANRGITRNVAGYMVYGDYARESPAREIVDAVARGDVDVSAVWGPTAGYFIRHSRVPLVATPVNPQIDLPFLPFVFDISMAVRRGDTALRDRLDGVLDRRRGEIDAILKEYGVPRLDVGGEL
jgi:mxaJ protein